MRKRVRTAVIIGAGPAGLTAAYELLTRSDIRPIVIEMSDEVGGISRTVNYRGNRIDLGGHRFFSKSDRVMNWWLQHLSLQETDAAANGAPLRVSYQGKSREVAAAPGGKGSADPQRQERVMMVRNRKSRIYFLRKFFDYPISLSSDTLKLGLARTASIGVSYMRRVLFPMKAETISSSSSSIASATSCTTRFSSPTPKKCGACPARRSTRNGERSASRSSPSGRALSIS